MPKEEKQIFPLLTQHFSFKEQASLVWKFMCSIPVNLMEEFLPWLVSSLSIDNRKEMIKCMCKIVLEEEFLQEVVFTWLKEKRSTGDFEESPVPCNEQGPPTSEESWCVKEVAVAARTSNQGSIVYECCKKMCKKLHFVSHDGVNNSVSELLKFPINEILHWNGAERNFRRGLKNATSWRLYCEFSFCWSLLLPSLRTFHIDWRGYQETTARVASTHEDDALFGDLFLDASRQAVISNVLDQTHPTFGTHCQLSDGYINAHVLMLQSQVCVDDKVERTGGSEVYPKHLLGHFHKVCFDLLHEHVMGHALSSTLEAHLVNQILKVEDGRCLSIHEVSGSLPSLFHLEVLLMDFHSPSALEKENMAQSIFSAFSTLNNPPLYLTSTQLAGWTKLRQIPQGGTFHLRIGLNHLDSWVYLVIQGTCLESAFESLEKDAQNVSSKDSQNATDTEDSRLNEAADHYAKPQTCAMPSVKDLKKYREFCNPNKNVEASEKDSETRIWREQMIDIHKAWNMGSFKSIKNIYIFGMRAGPEITFDTFARSTSLFQMKQNLQISLDLYQFWWLGIIFNNMVIEITLTLTVSYVASKFLDMDVGTLGIWSRGKTILKASQGRDVIQPVFYPRILNQEEARCLEPNSTLIWTVDGGNEETRSAFIAAAAAVPSYLLQRPVRITLDRDINMMFTGYMHTLLGKHKVGFSELGKIISARLGDL
eukprot:Gb_32431 [translate_table: standard]